MTKRKYSVEDFQRFLESIFPTYENLMKHHYGLVSVLNRRGTSEEKEVLGEIVGRALQESAKILFLEEKINLEYIQDKHPALDRAAREVYTRKDGKSPWQQVCEDAGLVYPCVNYKQRTLKSLLGEIFALGESPEEIRNLKADKKKTRLYSSTFRRLGNFGKAVILTGSDYCHFPYVTRKERYSFDMPDFEGLIKDTSLSYSDKVVCFFNAFALQYYGWEAEGKMSRNKESLEDYILNRQRRFFAGPFIEALLMQKVGEDPAFSVSMSLEGTSNTFYRQNFSFSGKDGKKRVTNAVDFFSYLATSLKVLDKRLQTLGKAPAPGVSP